MAFAGGVPEIAIPEAAASGGQAPDTSNSTMKARATTDCERANATPLNIDSPFCNTDQVHGPPTGAAARGLKWSWGIRDLTKRRERSGNPAIHQGQQPRGPEALRPRLATSLPLLNRLIGDAGHGVLTRTPHRGSVVVVRKRQRSRQREPSKRESRHQINLSRSGDTALVTGVAGRIRFRL